MKDKVFITGFLLAFIFALAPALAQEKTGEDARAAKKYMQQAQEALAEKDIALAEALYRQAVAKDPAYAEARYNLGNLYYQNEATGEAISRHSQAAEVTEDASLKHNSFHNQGNAFMKQKKYREAVEAYKNSLRNNPDDEETRYNLALAKKLLEEEKKGGGDEDKDQEKKDKQDQKKDQKKEDKEQQDDQGEKEKDKNGQPKENDQEGENENKDQKEGEKDENDQGKPENKDKQNNQDKKSDKEEPGEPQPRPGQLSPQQVKNLLEAMGNEEKKVQEKMNAKKMKGSKRKTEKDW